MKRLTIDITGKLDAGLIEMYRHVITEADKLSIQCFVIGAMARDLVLHHGFGAPIDRATRDIDFGIQVENWESFYKLKDALAKAGFVSVDKVPHRMHFRCRDNTDWMLDVLPFGNLTDENQDLSLPPDGAAKLSMLGFAEASSNAWPVIIDSDCTVPVASPWGIVMLKLISWGDRSVAIRAKDANDIAYIILQIQKIPTFLEELYSGGYAKACEYDNDEATALLLGKLIAAMATPQTLKFIAERTLTSPHLEKFVRDMGVRNAEAWAARLSESLL